MVTELRSRRIAAGVCLILGPALMVAGWAVFPSVADSNVEWVSDVVADPSRSAVGIGLVIVGLSLSILAYMALVHLQRERQPLLGDVGGALAMIGGALTVGAFGLVLAEVQAIRHLGDSEATAAMVDAIDESGVAVVVWLGPIVWTLGLVILAVGLVRAHAAPEVLAVGLGLGAIVHLVGMFFVGSVVMVVAGAAILFLSLAAIGVQLLLETDDDWEHVPEFRGFHRATIA